MVETLTIITARVASEHMGLHESAILCNTTAKHMTFWATGYLDQAFRLQLCVEGLSLFFCSMPGPWKTQVSE